MRAGVATTATGALLLAATALAQSCTSALTNSLPAPSVASGYRVQLVATGLSTPRGIQFDTAGNLLVVQKNHGVTALTFEDQDDDSGCVSLQRQKVVIDNEDLNHGIAISPDGQTLYASSTAAAYSWPYDPDTASTTGRSTTLVNNMTTEDHTTRTLLLSRQVPGMLIVTRGSTSNVDPIAEDITSGHSQIRAFNLDNTTSGQTYDFPNDGMLLGWGLRNDVGIAEHPISHGLYSVENSVDQLEVQGVDVHATNPGEELNFFGTLANNTSPNQGTNFGYPQCYAAFDPSVIPQNNGLEVGMQFVIGDSTADINNDFCQSQRTAPRLVFESHMAPLDIKFTDDGTQGWVSFHGSWNRAPLTPSGYKVSMIPFTTDGEPVASSTSTTGYMDIVANADNSQCPGMCFRPVGLAFDSQGRLFFSSDATGEIYVITKTSTTNGAVESVTATPTMTAATSSPTGDNTNLAAPEGPGRSLVGLGVACAAVVCALLLM